MSECTRYCLGKEEGHAHIVVTRPRFTEFLVRGHRRGARKYEVIGKSRSQRKAYRMLADAMLATRDFNRGDVLGCEGLWSYYEPTLMIQMTQ